MKEESTLRRFRRALAAIAVGVVGGLTGDGPESWAQAPGKPAAGATQVAPVAVKRDGPIQIVVPGEKRHSRWVRQVIALRIGRA